MEGGERTRCRVVRAWFRWEVSSARDNPSTRGLRTGSRRSRSKIRSPNRDDVEGWARVRPSDSVNVPTISCLTSKRESVNELTPFAIADSSALNSDCTQSRQSLSTCKTSDCSLVQSNWNWFRGPFSRSWTVSQSKPFLVSHAQRIEHCSHRAMSMELGGVFEVKRS